MHKKSMHKEKTCTKHAQNKTKRNKTKNTSEIHSPRGTRIRLNRPSERSLAQPPNQTSPRDESLARSIARSLTSQQRVPVCRPRRHGKGRRHQQDPRPHFFHQSGVGFRKAQVVADRHPQSSQGRIAHHQLGPRRRCLAFSQLDLAGDGHIKEMDLAVGCPDRSLRVHHDVGVVDPRGVRFVAVEGRSPRHVDSSPGDPEAALPGNDPEAVHQRGQGGPATARLGEFSAARVRTRVRTRNRTRNRRFQDPVQGLGVLRILGSAARQAGRVFGFLQGLRRGFSHESKAFRQK
mmetsp:Transcript_22365/g.62259  ORF Transcript_22365/g.62259 Transcript_22365/m.62259 type:complete len:291 (+) Transcript_22365:406-1278(+)